MATGVPYGQQVAPPAVVAQPLLRHRQRTAVVAASTSTGMHHCYVCSKSFASASNLRTHMLLHMDKKPHTCQVCGKKFSASSNLKAHAVVHTGERRFQCAECGKAFATSSHLKTHTVVHSGRRPYQCEICLREFSVSSNLRSHMFIHTGERRHECQVCRKQFTSSSHVKTHMLTHSGERPHKCDLCAKSFAVVSNLKAHRKIHLGQKDHACDVCGKLFYTSSDMKSHRTMHTGERPYQCDVCHERFGKRSNMRAHMLTHTGERPFQCGRCPKRFAKASTLRTHTAKWHPPQESAVATPSASALSKDGASAIVAPARAAGASKSPPCITLAVAATAEDTPTTKEADTRPENAAPESPHPKENGFGVDTNDFASNHPEGPCGPQGCDAVPANHLQTEAGTRVVANGCRATSRSGRVAVASSNQYTALAAISYRRSPSGKRPYKERRRRRVKGCCSCQGPCFWGRSSAVYAGSCKRARARKRVSRGSEGPHCEG
nr:zinc finger protein 98-like [Rhipicephalus microplus]